jgi:hypothetical protein
MDPENSAGMKCIISIFSDFFPDFCAIFSLETLGFPFLDIYPGPWKHHQPCPIFSSDFPPYLLPFFTFA